MKNSLLLSINIGILISYIFTYFCHDKIIDYSKDLSHELRKKYEKIRKERMTHFLIGVILSIAVGVAYYYFSEKATSMFQKINIILLIVLLLQMIVYNLLEKWSTKSVTRALLLLWAAVRTRNVFSKTRRPSCRQTWDTK